MEMSFSQLKVFAGKNTSQVSLIQDSDGKKYILKSLKKINIWERLNEVTFLFYIEKMVPDLTLPKVAKVEIKDRVDIYYEYLPYPDLFENLHIDNPKKFMLKTCQSLQKIHNLNIVHLDIKPENILITPTEEPIFIDFEFACFAEDYENSDAGTLAFQAPELSSPVDPYKLDVYSLGCTFYEILTGNAVYFGCNDVDTLKRFKLKKKLLGRNELTDTPFRPMIFGMTESSPKKRWSLKKVIEFLESV